MTVLSVVAAGGDEVSITEASVASSGVLSRLPARSASEPPVTLPFSAASICIWGAGTVEGVSSFEAALDAVADFLEAPTIVWARRACELAFAPECTAGARAAADALLATQTEQIRGVVDGIKLVLDGEEPLHEALHAPEELHALAIDTRLYRGGGAAPIADDEAQRVLQGLLGFPLWNSRAASVFAELNRSEDEGLGLPITTSYAGCRGRRHALTAAELPVAARALQGVAACLWLSIDGGHAQARQCKPEGRRVSSGGIQEDAVMSGDGGGGHGCDQDSAASDKDGTSNNVSGQFQHVQGRTMPDGTSVCQRDGGSDEDGVRNKLLGELLDSGGHGAADDEGGRGVGSGSSSGDGGSRGGTADSDAMLLGVASSGEERFEESGTCAPPQRPSACQALVDAAAAALTGVLGAAGAQLRLRSLALEALPLTCTQADALAAALATQTQLQRLALRRCPVATRSATHLLDTAAQLPALQSLELQYFLDNDPTEAALLVARLPRFQALTSLDLEGDNLLHMVPHATVAEALAALTTLRHLVLLDHDLHRSGTCARTVLSAMRGMSHLESFITEGDVFCLGPQTDEIWAALAANATMLTRLTLGLVCATADTAPGVRCLAGLTGLRHLDFMGNKSEFPDMTLPGAHALPAALAAMPLLTHLIIGSNCASSTSFRALAPALGQLKALRELALEPELADMYGDFAEVAAAFAEHCTGLSALRAIRAHRGLLTIAEPHSAARPAGGALLAPWLQCLPGVELFSIAGRGQGAASAAALCSALRGAVHLDISQQRMRVDAGSAACTSASYVKSMRPLRTLGVVLHRMSRLRSLHLNNNDLVCASVEALGACSRGRIGARMGELRHLNVACNALSGTGLAAVGEWAVACAKLERLNVSDQRDVSPIAGLESDRRNLTAAELQALAEVIAGRAGSSELLVVAHGCKSVSEAEAAAVRMASKGAARWDISNTSHWRGGL